MLTLFDRGMVAKSRACVARARGAWNDAGSEPLFDDLTAGERAHAVGQILDELIQEDPSPDHPLVGGIYAIAWDTLHVAAIVHAGRIAQGWEVPGCRECALGEIILQIAGSPGIGVPLPSPYQVAAIMPIGSGNAQRRKMN